MTTAMTRDLSHQPVSEDRRRHDLDALRAFAMLLGLALHAALSFMEIPWVVQDQSRAPGFGYFVSAIHGFRMPLFFLISGFFTTMLWRKRGLGGLLRQRAIRIALPLGLGCVTIVPLIWVIAFWAGAGNTTFGGADTDTDIWTASWTGDVAAVRQFVVSGESPDALEPNIGVTPLGMAALGDQPEVVGFLLEAGADPSGRYNDGNTPLHSAAFFGRAEVAELLLDAGADIHARSPQGEMPVDVMRHGKAITEFIAGALKMTIDFEAVEAGRDRIRELIDSRGGDSGQPATDAYHGANPLDALLLGLMYFPFFHHLWFLWFLCWLVACYTLVVVVFGRFPRVPVPSVLVASPWCLIWLVPLTMLTQSFMNVPGAMPFGPETSAGLLPIPHVLAYYAIFFGFGALVYGCLGAVDRLGRGWWIQLPLAFLILPFALMLAYDPSTGEEMIGDENTRRILANLGEALYVWLMTFGLMGLFEKVLSREHPWVRYMSDSSYWLYLVHLPLIIVGQALLREVNLPAYLKFTLLLFVTIAILLVSYQFLVRYTWIGTLLNGRRNRLRRTAPEVDDVDSLETF